MIDAESLYTTKELSTILGLHIVTITRYAKKGRLHPLVFGSKHKFKGSDVLQFLDSTQKTTSTSFVAREVEKKN